MDLLFAFSVLTFYFEYAMWKQFVKDYLNFTKKERNAVFVLLLLTTMFWVLPMVWPGSHAADADGLELKQLENELSLLKQPAGKSGSSDRDHVLQSKIRENNSIGIEKPNLFFFNPNTLDAAGWKRLGIKERTVHTIVNYLAKSGRFKKPDDLLRIYGFQKSDFERLQPYIQLGTTHVIKADDSSRSITLSAKRRPAHYGVQPAIIKSIEINTADTADFIALPGIGNKLAVRIIRFRDKLGGFSSVGQLAETYALPDSTFKNILPQLRCNSSIIKRIAINKADAFTLQQHPYLRKNYAAVIFKYRQQHGPFRQAADLLQIHLMNDSLLNKLLPYLDFE